MYGFRFVVKSITADIVRERIAADEKGSASRRWGKGSVRSRWTESIGGEDARKRIGEKKVGEMIGKDDGEVGGDHVLDGDGDEQ